MSKTIYGDRYLFFNGKLGLVGTIGEDGIIRESANDLVEWVWAWSSCQTVDLLSLSRCRLRNDG